MRPKWWHVCALTLAFGAAACSEQPTEAPIAPALSAVTDAGPPAPARGADTQLPRWSDATDDALWNEVVALDTVFAVGIKAPGARRGVYNGRWHVADAGWRGAQAALRNQPGVKVLTIDSLLPAMQVKISDRTTMAQVRRLPFIDYLEPARLRSKLAGFGCGYPEGPYEGYWSGGEFVARAHTLSNVTLAWHYAQGQGEIVGLTDTGVETRNYELGVGFTEGESGGRWLAKSQTTSDVDSYPFPNCSHGTRMAGVIAAPRNGMGARGIAYKASLFSAWVQNSLTSTNGTNQFQGIRDAALAGARTIVMAWATTYHSDWVSDEIDRLYYQPPPNDVVFVGAAGTTPCDLTGQNWIMFPANKYNVIAVSAANTYANGTRDCQSHWGPGLDVVSYAPVTTVGYYEYQGSVSHIDHSSGATAFVAGVVTLVRSRFPWMRNFEVMSQVKNTAGVACGPQTEFGPIVNALAAVGGPCVRYGAIQGGTEFRFSGTSDGDVAYGFYCVEASGGAGPLRIWWNTGGAGTIGPCATFEFPRGNYSASVVAEIRDLGNNVYWLPFHKTVNIYDDCQNPDVPVTISLCGLTDD